MPNRGAGGVSYRYGFNGKETENDVKGIGNEQDYGMRIYDPRLGRFLSVDPIASSYPWYTPFQFAGNTPIWSVDVDGLEPERPADPAVQHHLSNKELVDGVKLAQSILIKNLKEKKLTLNNIVEIKGQLLDAATSYVTKHKLSNAKTADFFNLVFKYHTALWGVANWNVSTINLITETLNDDRISDDRKMGIVNYGIKLFERKTNFFVGLTKDAVLFTAGSALFPAVGASQPRGPSSTLNLQEEIVNTAGLNLRKSVGEVLGAGYKSFGEVAVQIKNQPLLKSLNASSKGEWVKVYEAGMSKGKRIETHYFRNNSTGQVFDVKIKYEYWHQSKFKKIQIE